MSRAETEATAAAVPAAERRVAITATAAPRRGETHRAVEPIVSGLATRMAALMASPSLGRPTYLLAYGCSDKQVFDESSDDFLDRLAEAEVRDASSLAETSAAV